MNIVCQKSMSVVFGLSAIEAAVPEVGRDDAGEPILLGKAFLICAGRAGEAKRGVVHNGYFEVDDPRAAHGADRVGIFTVEHGREACRAAFGVMFKDQIGVVQPACGRTSAG